MPQFIKRMLKSNLKINRFTSAMTTYHFKPVLLTSIFHFMGAGRLINVFKIETHRKLLSNRLRLATPGNFENPKFQSAKSSCFTLRIAQHIVVQYIIKWRAVV